MATLVFFHAHPDDESISTSGVMADALSRGHRVVLVCATDGALGEVVDGTVPEGTTLAEVRASELHASASVIGAHRVELLGYGDSGMMDEPSNDDPDSFWQADVEEAATRLAAILDEEAAALLTVYDARGNYGHPDHIQVHRVGVRAAELAGTPHVFEATMNRDRMRELAALAYADADAGDPEVEARRREMEATELGSPAAEITHAVDVSAHVALKRRCMLEHRSQIAEDSFFLTMPEEAFVAAFGTEWFIERGASRVGPPHRTDLLASLMDTDGA